MSKSMRVKTMKTKTTKMPQSVMCSKSILTKRKSERSASGLLKPRKVIPNNQISLP